MGVKLEPLACVPSEATLTSRVVPVCRSRTKMSELSFASSGTRLSAHDENATYRPSAEADGQLLFDDVSPPPAATLTRSVVPWDAHAAGAAIAATTPIARHDDDARDPIPSDPPPRHTAFLPTDVVIREEGHGCRPPNVHLRRSGSSAMRGPPSPVPRRNGWSPRNRLPGKSLRTADSPEASVCGCIGGSGTVRVALEAPEVGPTTPGRPGWLATTKA
jgi:hypothetical protein